MVRCDTQEELGNVRAGVRHDRRIHRYVSSIRSWLRPSLACILTGAAVSAASAAQHSVPLLPAVSATGPQGFVRVINHSDIPGEVVIDAFDDTGRSYGPLVLSVRAGGTTHFNSHDLENGNTSKGLLGRTGSGDGNWRLTLSSRVDGVRT